MYKLSLLFSMLITLTINAKTETSSELNFINSEFVTLEIEQFDLESDVFSDLLDNELNIADIEVVEVEEDVEIDFDTIKHLPKNFNALAGKNDIDWIDIKLVELEEDVELGFDTRNHLPNNFNPYKGMDHEKDVVVCLY